MQPCVHLQLNFNLSCLLHLRQGINLTNITGPVYGPCVCSLIIHELHLCQKVEKECVPKFGVQIFNLALVIKKWPHQAGSTVVDTKNGTFYSNKPKKPLGGAI